jgi:hypothetical protein
MLRARHCRRTLVPALAVPVAPAIAAPAAALLLLCLPAFALGGPLLLGRPLLLLGLTLLRRPRRALLLGPAASFTALAAMWLAIASLLEPWLLLAIAMLLALAVAATLLLGPLIATLMIAPGFARRGLRNGLHRRGRGRRGSRLEQAEEAAEDAHGGFGRRLHDR